MGDGYTPGGVQLRQLTPLAEAIAGRPVVQIGLVVRDLDVALERYAAVLGEGTWRCYSLSAATHATAEYKGGPTDFSVRLAFNDQSPHWELVQPLAGRSIHRDWLDEGGEGLHHLGITVESVADATKQMAQAGYPAIQAGTGFGADDDGSYAYFAALDGLGLLLEVFEPAARMRGPEVVWSRGTPLAW